MRDHSTAGKKNAGKNYNDLVNSGLLMPQSLAHANMKILGEALRDAYLKSKDIRNLYTYEELLMILNKDVQRAQYECLVLNLAKALEGFQIYLPVFLDFRGRIYRCGILHFHERDLARSLLLFDTVNCYKYQLSKTSHIEPPFEDKVSILKKALSFHYKAFENVENAKVWFDTEYEVILQKGSASELIKFASGGKKPFQLISSSMPFILNDSNLLLNIPITQDASASAYQITSVLLLNKEMGYHTNLISKGDDCIHDIYLDMLYNLKKYIIYNSNYNTALKRELCLQLNRKLVKSIFMPIIYGKTVHSTAGEIRNALSQFITYKESIELAKTCYSFWKEYYSNLDCLIKLVKTIGWVVSARDCQVLYRTDLFSTVQDYMLKDPVNIWVYDRKNKKRRQVTLRVSTDKRDKKKSQVSTFVNFIHQRDAHIAMSVVTNMILEDAPIYTVHDNFITTVDYSSRLPAIYVSVLREIDPLSIINDFIYHNVIVYSDKLIEGDSLVYNGDGNIDHLDCIIDEDMLRKCLNHNIPDSHKKTKKDRDLWENKINTILCSYREYTDSLCKSPFGVVPKDYEKYDLYKWNLNDFRRRMGGSPNYSIHY